MTKQLLIKFFNDECSQEELDIVITWIKSKSSDYSIDWVRSIWNIHETDDSLPGDEKFNALLDKIHHKINISSKKEKESKNFNLVINWITRIAALLLLPSLVFLYYSQNQNVSLKTELSLSNIDTLEVVTPVGSKTTIQLSDGTKVYLNHGSKLRYPQKFVGNSREVSLIGEGYFKVHHQPENPFIVKTDNMQVRAVGTSFNVFAYPDEAFSSATLVDGKLIIDKKTNDNGFVTIGTMIPGQHVTYNKNTGLTSSTLGEIEKYISWREGKLVFKRDSIIQIAHRLSRWYNVDIEFADEEAKEFTYTATFTDEPLDHILDVLKDAAPIDYKKLPRQKLSDGSFSKQKIIITKRK
ncbi:MAG TPA: FecR family protein [Ignavibacteria bacterium]|nr:FecR family protein [Ignavibacteria bacterium]